MICMISYATETVSHSVPAAVFWVYFWFLLDPGKPGVRSLGPDVSH